MPWDISELCESVTPAQAKQLLGGNTHNRSVRAQAFQQYKRAMLSGDWRRTGDPIRVAKDGTLLDGQHRLMAIVDTGVTCQLVVLTGLEKVDQEVIDGGVKRKFSDTLKLRGEQNTNALAAIARLIWLYERGHVRGGGGAPSRLELLRVVENTPEIREAARVADRVNRTTLLGRAVIGWAYVLFYRIDRQDAEFFFERLTTGVGLEDGSPILALRKRYTRTDAVIRGAERPMFAQALLTKAWNAYREGNNVQHLRWRAGGSSPEVFPEPV